MLPHRRRAIHILSPPARPAEVMHDLAKWLAPYAESGWPLMLKVAGPLCTEKWLAPLYYLRAIDSERRDEFRSSVLSEDQKGSLAMRCGLWLPLLLLCCADTMAVDGPAKIVGSVVDRGSHPLAGVSVASFWTIQGQAGLRPNRSCKTDSEGRFSLVLDRTSVDTALLAFDSSRKVGGLAVVSSKHPDRPLRIEVAPLVELRGRFTCNELSKAPAETGIWIGFPPTDQPLLTSFAQGLASS